MRERLPNRRDAELIAFIHKNRRWTATIARFSDGRIAEVFIDAERVDPLAMMAQEAAIAASLALQAGCPLKSLQHALEGRSEGPLAEALALIEPAR